MLRTTVVLSLRHRRAPAGPPRRAVRRRRPNATARAEARAASPVHPAHRRPPVSELRPCSIGRRRRPHAAHLQRRRRRPQHHLSAAPRPGPV